MEARRNLSPEEKLSIYDLSFDDLTGLMKAWGEPQFRTEQIWHGLYKSLWVNASDFQVLPAGLQSRLDREYSFVSLHPIKHMESTDRNTLKILYQLNDGNYTETVLMTYPDRNTVCVSTQSGCALGCVFCATGQMGFVRNLTAGEIIEQVIYFSRHLRESDDSITNIVFMGMGEPFHNYDYTLGAIDRLNDGSGLNIGARRITVSTVGLVPEIRRFTLEDRQINLAVSLHAADNKLRTSLLPINKKYPLEMLIDSCVDYVKTTSRRITFEWALIDGVNDSTEQAIKLANLLEPFRIEQSMLCHVNLIPLNPTPEFRGDPTKEHNAIAFKSELNESGIPCTIRKRRGIDIQAGCGQLAIAKVKNPPN